MGRERRIENEKVSAQYDGTDSDSHRDSSVSVSHITTARSILAPLAEGVIVSERPRPDTYQCLLSC